MEWDRFKRAETLFIDFLGVRNNKRNRAKTKRFLVNAWAKANYKKHEDHVLILSGPQGIGKTILVQKFIYFKEIEDVSLVMPAVKPYSYVLTTNIIPDQEIINNNRFILLVSEVKPKKNILKTFDTNYIEQVWLEVATWYRGE